MPCPHGKPYAEGIDPHMAGAIPGMCVLAISEHIGEDVAPWEACVMLIDYAAAVANVFEAEEGRPSPRASRLHAAIEADDTAENQESQPNVREALRGALTDLREMGQDTLADQVEKGLDAADDDYPLEDYPKCPECGNPIDYCQGHGPIAAEVM